MVIGSLLVGLTIPSSHSLKQKRTVLHSLLARIRRHFSVAAAEVADQDIWQSAVIGVVCVSGEVRHADEICQKVLRYIENDADAMVTRSSFELIHV